MCKGHHKNIYFFMKIKSFISQLNSFHLFHHHPFSLMCNQHKYNLLPSLKIKINRIVFIFTQKFVILVTILTVLHLQTWQMQKEKTHVTIKVKIKYQYKSAKQVLSNFTWLLNWPLRAEITTTLIMFPKAFVRNLMDIITAFIVWGAYHSGKSI